MMKMSVTTLSLFFFLSLFLAIHTANGFNITAILDKYPDYSTFNSYLTQTNIAREINSRQTITVLAVENSNVSPLSGKPSSVLKNILSVHVILDYYDAAKLQKISKNSAILTTLFQSTGEARNNQGFVNVTKLSTDSIAFGSAAPGSAPGSNLIKSIASQPYNISVLQVSNVILPPGIDESRPSTAPSGAPKTSPPAPPTASPKSSWARSPTKSVSPAPTQIADAPLADAPASADAPSADAPASADAPLAVAPAGDEAEPPSAGSALHIGLAVVLTMVLSTLYLASRI